MGAELSLASGDVARAEKNLDALNSDSKSRAAIAATNLANKLARTKAAAAIRARRKAEAARKAAEAATKARCSPPSNPFGVRQLPANGTWKGMRGNSAWTPDLNTERGQKIWAATGGKPIKFKDGYPEFTPFAKKRVEIEMTGKNSDFDRANEAAGLSETPADMTWHHHQDGVTMELVPSKINNNVPHDGGASIVKDGGF